MAVAEPTILLIPSMYIYLETSVVLGYAILNLEPEIVC